MLTLGGLQHERGDGPEQEIRSKSESVMKFVIRDHRWNLRQSSTPSRGLSEAAMMTEIGRDLRSMYNDLLREPLPEHLACIVRELDKRSPQRH